MEDGIKPIVCDPVASGETAKKFYNVDLVPLEELKNLDCLILAVAHKEFKALTNDDIAKMFKDESNSRKVIIDVKGIKDKEELEALGYKYWRL